MNGDQQVLDVQLACIRCTAMFACIYIVTYNELHCSISQSWSLVREKLTKWMSSDSCHVLLLCHSF